MGRRPLGPCVVVTSIRLTCDQAKWVRAHPGTPSSVLRNLIDDAIWADEADFMNEVAQRPARRQGDGDGRFDDVGAEVDVGDDVADDHLGRADRFGVAESADDGMPSDGD